MVACFLEITIRISMLKNALSLVDAAQKCSTIIDVIIKKRRLLIERSKGGAY